MDLRAVEKEIIDLDAVPLLGGASNFPLEQVAEDLSHRFQTEVHLDVGVPSWQEPHIEQDIVVGIAIPDLEGHALFAMSVEEVQAAMRLLLGGDRYGQALYDSSLRIAFVRFLCLELLHAAEVCGYPPGLTPQIIESPQVTGKALTLELHAEAAGQHTGGRLLISQPLLTSWRHHFAPQKPHHLSEELRQTLVLTLGIEVGETQLPLSQLSSLEVGDVLLLDSISEERVHLTLGDKPLHSAKRHNQTLTIGD